MEQLYQWIRNITYYLIFITVAENLLPNKKYEKYIKFFAGMVLILLVLKPVTGGLRLDDKLAYSFEAISLKKEAGELTGKVSKMEETRLKRMISGYENAVGTDLETMAETAGFSCIETSAKINSDQSSDRFGHVVNVSLVLTSGKEEMEAEEAASVGSNLDPVKKVEDVKNIKITVKESNQSTEKTPKDGKNEEQKENSSLSGLRRRIAEYYGLEEQDIEIQMEDG
ncbi:stage III sporulation protein AF [Clostridium boliviensis]|uniref:Stage III sporulation protein AF n=1 Tax=Clostridium boliviensis TaxID=318465 RepID=A0ABU4GHU4_9CLOT|nr:stage III sporulation protein AF [Clostridium boliviensis]MDW2797161.1 stage III sporulation protein AF [Clostridium boliviensis]